MEKKPKLYIKKDNGRYEEYHEPQRPRYDNALYRMEVEVKVDAGGYPYIDCNIELYDYEKDIPLAKKDDKVKLIIVKED